jgi:hypothetical protein
MLWTLGLDSMTAGGFLETQAQEFHSLGPVIQRGHTNTAGNERPELLPDLCFPLKPSRDDKR